MGSIFLDIAEQVLSEMGHPMSARDIYNYASSKNLIKSDGLTPENTLRARLSENIKQRGFFSKFMRTGANKFALREWIKSKEDLKEYVAPNFEKDYSKEYVVCFSQEDIDKTGRFFGFNKNYKPYLSIISNRSNLTVIKRSEANKTPNLKQIIAYVLLKDKKGNYLSYQRGNYSNKNQLLKDVLCIGFGGHVNSEDLYDLFGISNGGIWNAAYREVGEEVKSLLLPGLKLIGVINDDSSYLGLTHFSFVFEAKLPDNFNIEDYNTELSINKLKLLSKKELKNNFHKLEFWSQILAKKLNVKADDFVKIVKRKKGISKPIVIVGGIGSGKSEVSKILARATKYEYISTREIVADLIKKNDFANSNRAEFQNESFDFINNKNGTTILAAEILKKIQKYGDDVIIDGIRQIETYEKLKKLSPKMMLIYIETSRDKAYDFFRTRSKRKATIHEFRNAVSHEVEKEVPLFKHRADVYIFNGDSISALTRKIIKWLNDE